MLQDFRGRTVRPRRVGLPGWIWGKLIELYLSECRPALRRPIFAGVVFKPVRTPRGRPQLHAVQGNPIQLGKDEYFVLGDNSPSSLDSRFWQTQGPHLEGAGFQLGTVPASQMIGRAFFVYWPGFLPLWKGEPIFQVGPRSSGWNLLPNFGKIRWIY